MKKLIFLSIMGLFFSASCERNHDNMVVDQLATEAPETYAFFREGVSTVSYTGQSQRIAMAEELVDALKNNTTPLFTLQSMFDHQLGEDDFVDDQNLGLNNSSKSIRSKTAASVDFFSANSTDAALIKSDFDSWILEQENEVFPNWSFDAAPGHAGKIQEAGGGPTRYVNKKGLELNQAVNKGLIGALMTDQMLNNYLSTSVLDAGTNVTDNDLGILVEGKNYTTMEHKWDEAFGYLYGADNQENPSLGADSFLSKYLARVDADPDFSGIAETLYNAFKLGRAAISNKDYVTRDHQAEIIREHVSKIIAIRAMYYMQEGKSNLGSDWASAFHDLSEGFGFLYSLQFTRQPNLIEPYFSKSEVDALIATLMQGNGFWEITTTTLDALSETIATRFEISLASVHNK